MAPNDLTEKIGHKIIEFQYCRNGKQSKNNKTWAMFQCFQSTTTELNSMVEGVLLLCWNVFDSPNTCRDFGVCYSSVKQCNPAPSHII